MNNSYVETKITDFQSRHQASNNTDFLISVARENRSDDGGIPCLWIKFYGEDRIENREKIYKLLKKSINPEAVRIFKSEIRNKKGYCKIIVRRKRGTIKRSGKNLSDYIKEEAEKFNNILTQVFNII